MRTRARWALAALVVAGVIAVRDVPRPSSSASVRSGRALAEGRQSPAKLRWSAAARDAALRRAALWRPPPDLSAPRASDPSAWPRAIECRFEPEAAGGTTPKFDCTTAAGESLKVKYAGAEPHAEVAASRLLRALGFPADEVRFVERVRCYGCPAFPYLSMRVLGLVQAHALYGRSLDYERYRDIPWAAVERRHPGREIEGPSGRGWSWYELRRVDAPRAHVDALRLAAIFLAHWDNKAENQRLMCLDEDAAPRREHCERPVALVQDLGATFGPRKVDLARWRRAAIWDDRGECAVSMERMPHGGSTFEPVQISEDGRQLLAGRLGALSSAEVRAIFDEARFAAHDGRPVGEWVEAFRAKVREISAGPPCPAQRAPGPSR